MLLGRAGATYPARCGRIGHNGRMTARSWVWADAEGSQVAVWVVPSASREGIVGVHGDALKVRVTAAPERGRATEAVRRLLARRLETEVELGRGRGSRRKVFRVGGLAPEEVATRLGVPVA